MIKMCSSLFGFAIYLKYELFPFSRYDLELAFDEIFTKNVIRLVHDKTDPLSQPLEQKSLLSIYCLGIHMLNCSTFFSKN